VIVDPDFLDHWRTGMVTDALGDPTAPLCILRLWAHCQERKSDTFAMPTRGLKAQCKFQGDAEAFEKALIEAGFIERDGDNIIVCGWAEKNASLIAAWENGKTGGRPRKEKNPTETHGKPTGNPAVTQGEPSENPSATQAKPIREEKIREEEIQEPSVLVDTPSANRPPACPNDQIVDLYHRRLPTLPRVEVLNDTRKRHIAARWREVLADPDIAKSPTPRESALEFFDWFFDHASKSPFLTGKAKDWRADLDFLMTPTKFVKVIEGHYHKETA